MLNGLESYALLRIVTETDNELQRWTARLSKDKYLELGDDPELVLEVEQTLQLLAAKLRKLGPQFDLSRVPLSRANMYFTTTRQLDQALSFVRSIRERDRGSRQNTRQCLMQLAQCSDSVRRMGLNATTSEVRH